MYSTILSDFSRVILDVKNKDYKGSLNSLYKELVAKQVSFNFFDYFELNRDILTLYSGLKSKYSINIFTTGTIQKAPEIKSVIDSIFEKVFVAEELGLDKKAPNAYIKIAEMLSKSPDDIIYIDDQPENIKAAKEAGLSTFLYTEFEKLSKNIATYL